MTSFHFSHAALIAIGAFYTFAGLVGIKAALQSRFMDIAIAKISLKSPPKVETGRAVWLLLGGIGVLAGGLFLILRLEWAAIAFAASALAQAFYLIVLAPLVFDRDDPPDAKGRQQTINAFILYSAATLFVLWAYRTDKLMPAYAVGWPSVYAALCVLVAAAAWGVFRFIAPLSKGPFAAFRRTAEADADGGVPDYSAEDETGPPLAESRRILVMSEYQCDPLWTHDPGRSGTISPRDLPLSDELVTDLEAWALHYDGSFNLEDLANPHWSEADYTAHDQAGVTLARRLKRELPDRQIYVWRTGDGNYGHVEITADEL